MRKNTISAVIMTYNDEKRIKDCLESIKDVVDEIVIIDNSSTDKTLEIAKKFTKYIYKQENDPLNIDFQKNKAFKKATSDWILSLDADERVTPELSKEIENLKLS